MGIMLLVDDYLTLSDSQTKKDLYNIDNYYIHLCSMNIVHT